MKNAIRHGLSALLFATLVATPTLAATPFPIKAIRVIINVSPGSLLDTTTRAVAQKMSENLGQPMVAVNNAGSGGLLGSLQVKSAPPDGYTLLGTAGSLVLASAFRLEPGYELKDFAPISAMTQTPYIMVGAVSLPDKTLAELVVRAKANPGTLNYAVGGTGSTTHMAAAMLVSQAGIKMQYVPYKGVATAMSDVLGGRVYFVFDGPTTAVPLIRDGRLRAYGITAKQRSPIFPDIPTIAEQGYPNYSYIAYNGMVAPAGTPREVVQYLNQAMRSALGSDALRERFRKEGQEPMPLAPEEFAELLRQDAQWANKLVVEMGIPKE